MATEKVTLSVGDGTQMDAYAARPSGAQAKGIVVLQEAFGVNDYVRRMAERFVSSGYLAIAPELFHRTAPGFEADYEKKEGVAEQMGALTDEGIAADILAAHAWLLENGAPQDKIAVIGFCMGGRAAFLGNIILPFAAAVSFYGGRIAEQLLPRTSSLHAPQFFVWGGTDKSIGSEQRRAVADALTEAGKPFVSVLFSEAGHGFACDARESYHAPSAAQAWALTDAFLEEHLG